MHASWSVMLNSPDFWLLLDKEHLGMLSSVCRSFRAEIPQRTAILSLFKDRVIKKVNLFKILPLSVRDVLVIRSPVNFIKVFLIAEQKAGGFDNCLALVRERGWRCWTDNGKKRAEIRAKIERLLRDKGVEDMPVSDPVYRTAVILQQRTVDRVAVWCFACTYERLISSERYNPYTETRIGSLRAGLDQRLEFSRALHRSQEYEQLLKTLKNSFGYWYKGINADVRSILAQINAVRASDQSATKFTTVLVSNRVLLVGKVSLRHWA